MAKPAKKSVPRRGAVKRPSKRPMLPTDRIAYSPITQRAPLKLPNGARMVVWVIVNVEEWDATSPCRAPC